LYIQPNVPNTLSSNFIALGIFGVLVTLGLLIFELKGILKCTQFIFLGRWIESKMKGIAEDNLNKKDFDKLLTGYFTELSKGGTWGNVITEPVASAVIYSTVLAAWSFVIFIQSGYLKILIPIIVFFLFAVSVYVFWQVVLKTIKDGFEEKRILRITKKLNARVELVWEAWTNPQHIVNWWAPSGFTTTIRKMDVREGEEWLLTLHGPDGKNYPNKSIFREVIPLKKIVYEHFNPEFIGTAVFESKGNKTLMEWTLLFETTELFEIVVKTFQADKGLKQNVGKLENYLAQISTSELPLT